MTVQIPSLGQEEETEQKGFIRDITKALGPAGTGGTYS